MKTTGNYLYSDFTNAICDWHKARLINLGDNLTREVDHNQLIAEYIAETGSKVDNPFLLEATKIWIARNHIITAMQDGLNVQTFIDSHVDFELHSVNIPKIENYEKASNSNF